MTPNALRQRLLEHFPDAQVEITDLTGTQDHYEVRVVTPDFAGMRLIKRHRAVNAAVADELADGSIHALALKTWTPEEWEAKRGG